MSASAASLVSFRSSSSFDTEPAPDMNITKLDWDGVTYSGMCWNIHSMAGIPLPGVGLADTLFGLLAGFTFLVMLTVVYTTHRRNTNSSAAAHHARSSSSAHSSRAGSNADQPQIGSDALVPTDAAQQQQQHPNTSPSFFATSFSALSSDGQTSTTVSFSSYVRFLHVSAFWALCWVIFNLAPSLTPDRTDKLTLVWHAGVAAVVYTSSVFLELSVVIFLLNKGVGARAFKSAAMICGFVSILYGALNLYFRLAVDIPRARRYEGYPMDQIDFISSNQTILFLGISSVGFATFFLTTAIRVWRRGRKSNGNASSIRSWRKRKSYAVIPSSAAQQQQRRPSIRIDGIKDNDVITQHNPDHDIIVLPDSSSSHHQQRQDDVTTSLLAAASVSAVTSPQLQPQSASASFSSASKSTILVVSPLPPPAIPRSNTATSYFLKDDDDKSGGSGGNSADMRSASPHSPDSGGDGDITSTPPFRSVVRDASIRSSRTPSPLPGNGLDRSQSIVSPGGGRPIHVSVSSLHNPPTRRSVIPYSLFLAFYYTLKSTGCFLLYHDLDSGICLLDGGILIYMLVYAFLLYMTLVADSKYWQEVLNSVEVVCEDEEAQQAEERRRKERLTDDSSSMFGGGGGGGGGGGNGNGGSNGGGIFTTSSNPSAYQSNDLGLPPLPHGRKPPSSRSTVSTSESRHLRRPGSRDEDTDPTRVSLANASFSGGGGGSGNPLSPRHRQSGSGGGGQSVLLKDYIIPPSSLSYMRALLIPEAIKPSTPAGASGSSPSGGNPRRRTPTQQHGRDSPILSRSGSGSNKGVSGGHNNNGSTSGSLTLSASSSKWSMLSNVSSRVSSSLRVVTGASDRWRCELFLARKSVVTSLGHTTSYVGIKQFTLPSLTADFFRRDFQAWLNLVPMGPWMGCEPVCGPNIAQVLGVTVDPPCVSLVFEYGARGTLYDVLHPLRQKVDANTTQQPHGQQQQQQQQYPHHAITIPTSPPTASTSILIDQSHAATNANYQTLSGGDSSSSSSSSTVHITLPPSPQRMPRSISGGAVNARGEVLIPQNLLPLLNLHHVATQLARAMAQLHKWSGYDNHPLHLSPVNITLTESLDLLVCDFDGPATLSTSSRKRAAAAPAWTAPEVLSGGKQTRASNVYSFATILWGVMTHRYPCVLVAHDHGLSSTEREASRSGSRSSMSSSRDRSYNNTPTQTPQNQSMQSKRQNPAYSSSGFIKPSPIGRSLSPAKITTATQSARSVSSNSAIVSKRSDSPRSSPIHFVSSSLTSPTATATTTTVPSGGASHVSSPAAPHTPDSSRPPSPSHGISSGGDDDQTIPAGGHVADEDDDFQQQHHDDRNVFSSSPPPAPMLCVSLGDFKLCQRFIVVENLRPPIPIGCPQRISRLLELCWDENPDDRPSFDIICEYLETQCQGEMENLQLPLPIPHHDEIQSPHSHTHQQQQTQHQQQQQRVY